MAQENKTDRHTSPSTLSSTPLSTTPLSTTPLSTTPLSTTPLAINFKCNKMKNLLEEWLKTLEINSKTFYEEFFTQHINLRHERQKFHSARQAPDETILSYVARLRGLGKNCHFSNYSTEDAILDKLIEQCPEYVKKSLLCEPDLTLYKALEIISTDKSCKDTEDTHRNTIHLFNENNSNEPEPRRNSAPPKLLYEAKWSNGGYKLELTKNRRNEQKIFLFEGES